MPYYMWLISMKETSNSLLCFIYNILKSENTMEIMVHNRNEGFRLTSSLMDYIIFEIVILKGN